MVICSYLNEEIEMKVIRMVRGQVVREREFKDRYLPTTKYNLTTAKFWRRANRLFGRRYDFVESIGDGIILNCGDNFLRVIDS